MGRNGGTHPRFSRKIGGREDIFPCCGGPLLVHWRQEVIVMRFERETGRIFARDESGKLLAEVTFPDRDGAAEIDHTFVDPSLEGRGVAGQLLQAAADALRAEGRKVRPTCSYAVRWFEKHPEQRDLLE